MQAAKKILVFDSGIGGLSVVAALRAITPDLDIHYVADNAAFPYGALNDAILLTRVSTVLEYALTLTTVDAVVIACNTVSTLMLDQLRARFAVRIFGVVPPIKPAAECSGTRCIGLLATPATLRQPYINDLVQKHAKDCEIVRIGSPELARLAEVQARGQLQANDQERIQTLLQPLFLKPGAPVDAVVLGCTHYPFLLDTFKAVAPYAVQWFDPAPAVARHLSKVMGALDLHGKTQITKQANRLYFTADPLPTTSLSYLFETLGFKGHEILLAFKSKINE